MSESDANEGARIPLGMEDLASHAQFLRQPPEELFHYTSLDGFRGIVESKSIHLTKFAYLNDRSELKLAIELFRSVVDQTMPTLSDTKHKRFLTDVASQLGSFERTNICVASFCEDPDLLSQWKSYGSAGRGVALGFSGSVLGRASNSGWANLCRCVYDHRVQRQIVNDLVDILLKSLDIVDQQVSESVRERTIRDLVGYFNTTFLRVAPVLKDAHFSEEREWRLVSVPRNVTDPKYRSIVSDTRTREYYLYEFQSGDGGIYDFLISAMVGPTPDPDHVAGPIDVLCRRENVALNTIRFSQIPYRA